jgi:regulator of protease activity HflC (stomatin/prohibitin superfamily)
MSTEELAQRAAERVREVIAEAERRAERIVAEAEAEAARIRERAQAEAAATPPSPAAETPDPQPPSPTPDPPVPRPDPTPPSEPIPEPPVQVAGDNGSGDDAGARLLAMKLALEGKGRGEIASELESRFGAADRGSLLDDVLARAGR